MLCSHRSSFSHLLPTLPVNNEHSKHGRQCFYTAGGAPTLSETQPCLTDLSKQRLICKEQRLHLPEALPLPVWAWRLFCSGKASLAAAFGWGPAPWPQVLQPYTDKTGTTNNRKKCPEAELIWDRNKARILGLPEHSFSSFSHFPLSTPPNFQCSDNRKAGHGRTTGVKKSPFFSTMTWIRRH